MTQDELNHKLAALEALAFIHGEPISLKKISETLKVTAEETTELVAEFEKRLSTEGRGLALISMGDSVQLATKPELNSALEDFVKSELTEELSPASLEVLSVISYLGPISRSRLEYIRGVNSSFILRNLLIRGLVERFPDPEYSLAYLYQPTFELLRHMGVNSAKDFPEYEKFRGLLIAAENAPLPPSPDMPEEKAESAPEESKPEEPTG